MPAPLYRLLGSPEGVTLLKVMAAKHTVLTRQLVFWLIISDLRK